jgi:selenocysteine lyase/cysteine desulfurase
VSFRVEGDSTDLVRRLYEGGVIVRDVPGAGWIRVSCGWWTSDDDLDRLLAALP